MPPSPWKQYGSQINARFTSKELDFQPNSREPRSPTIRKQEGFPSPSLQPKSPRSCEHPSVSSTQREAPDASAHAHLALSPPRTPPPPGSGSPRPAGLRAPRRHRGGPPRPLPESQPRRSRMAAAGQSRPHPAWPGRRRPGAPPAGRKARRPRARRRPCPFPHRRPAAPGRTLLLAEPLLEAAAPEPPPSVGRGPPAAAAAPAALEAALEALEAVEAAAALRPLFSFRFFLSRLAKKSSRLLSSVSAMAPAGPGAAPNGGGRRREAAGPTGAVLKRLQPAGPARCAAAGGCRTPRWWPPLDTARSGGGGASAEGRGLPADAPPGGRARGGRRLPRVRRSPSANERPRRKGPPASRKPPGRAADVATRECVACGEAVARLLIGRGGAGAGAPGTVEPRQRDGWGSGCACAVGEALAARGVCGRVPGAGSAGRWSLPASGQRSVPVSARGAVLLQHSGSRDISLPGVPLVLWGRVVKAGRRTSPGVGAGCAASSGAAGISALRSTAGVLQKPWVGALCEAVSACQATYSDRQRGWR